MHLLMTLTLCVCVFLQDPSDLRRPSVPVQQVSRLVSRVVEMLPEKHAQYNMALHLLEAVDMLQEDE